MLEGLPGEPLLIPGQGPPPREHPQPRASLLCVLQGTSTMAEKTLPSPGRGITPLQQMLASGTGAILTSLFGEDHGERVGAGG